MDSFNLVEITTAYGKLYLKEMCDKINNIKIPNGKMYECFTGEECEVYFNYIKFN